MKGEEREGTRNERKKRQISKKGLIEVTQPAKSTAPFA